MEVIPETRRAH